MQNRMKILAVAAVAGARMASAEAGIMGRITEAATGEVVSLVVSAVAVVIAGIMGVLFIKVARTFRETGEFLSALGGALDDRRITREEIAMLVREAKDIYRIWR